MILYLVIIAVAECAIILVNALYSTGVFGFSVLYAVLAPLILTLFVIAHDGLLAFLIRRLPTSWFDHERAFFVVKKREKQFYKKIGVPRWKSKVPDLGFFTGLRKNKIERPRDNEYLARYLLEADYGEVIHLVTAFTGFFLIFVTPIEMCLCFAIPVAFFNCILNLMPFCVLRYNAFALQLMYKRNALRENSLQAANNALPIAGA